MYIRDTNMEGRETTSGNMTNDELIAQATLRKKQLMADIYVESCIRGVPVRIYPNKTKTRSASSGGVTIIDIGRFPVAEDCDGNLIPDGYRVAFTADEFLWVGEIRVSHPPVIEFGFTRAKNNAGLWFKAPVAETYWSKCANEAYENAYAAYETSKSRAPQKGLDLVAILSTEVQNILRRIFVINYTSPPQSMTTGRGYNTPSTAIHNPHRSNTRLPSTFTKPVTYVAQPPPSIPYDANIARETARTTLPHPGHSINGTGGETGHEQERIHSGQKCKKNKYIVQGCTGESQLPLMHMSVPATSPLPLSPDAHVSGLPASDITNPVQQQYDAYFAPRPAHLQPPQYYIFPPRRPSDATPQPPPLDVTGTRPR